MIVLMVQTKATRHVVKTLQINFNELYLFCYEATLISPLMPSDLPLLIFCGV